MTGTCLCQAVRFRVEGTFGESHHCHCSRCRKGHGAAFATYASCATSELHFDSTKETLAVYKVKLVSRSFCNRCGSSLFFTHAFLPDRIWIAVGTLDEPFEAHPDAHSFVGSKASWWTIDDALPKYDGQRPELGG